MRSHPGGTVFLHLDDQLHEARIEISLEPSGVTTQIQYRQYPRVVARHPVRLPAWTTCPFHSTGVCQATPIRVKVLRMTVDQIPEKESLREFWYGVGLGVAAVASAIISFFVVWSA